MYKIEKAKVYYCDICNKQLNLKESVDLSLTFNGYSNFKGKIYWNSEHMGDFCPECADKVISYISNILDKNFKALYLNDEEELKKFRERVEKEFYDQIDN